MARAVHPGLASLGATFATGCWPERHGVVRGIEPHPDRLSLAPARPENRGIPAIWSDVVRAGRRAAVVGWPHDTAELDSGQLDSGERARLAWTGRAVTQPREEKAEHSPVLSGGLVRPPSRLPGMLDRRGEVDHDLTLELLEDQAKEGPDLLMGLVVDRTVEATPDATSERIRGIESRLAQARGVPPMVIEVRHPMPSESILTGPRFGATPRIRVDGIGRLELPVRPRVDAIASAVRGQLGVEPARPNPTVRSGSGFRGDALDEAGLPNPRRLSIFQLKAYEQDLHREIGLSRLARGDRQGAVPWLRGSCQDQHGRLDLQLAVLLLSLADPRTRPGLLAELRSRLGDLAATVEAWFDGKSMVDSSSLARLGPFVAGQLALGLRRAGRLRIDEPNAVDETLPRPGRRKPK